MKKLIASSILISFALPVLAIQPENPGYSLPPNAKQVAENVYSLGFDYDSDTHGIVQGYAIVHRKNEAKGSGSARSPKAPSCYGFIASGAKWKGSAEPWQVSVSGSPLDGNFIFANLASDINTWEVAAGDLDILGTGAVTVNTPTNKNVSDGINEVSFGAISDSNTIAVTTVWGYFSGPTFSRQIVEWDQVYNTDFDWSATGEADKMDFWNIAVHELGHAMGLGDIYNSSCSTVTMYGYASEGDINKRDLAPADITGINILY